jgi:hypothetical protein
VIFRNWKLILIQTRPVTIRDMSEVNRELDDSVLSTGKGLGPLHPDFPRDTTTERFLRTWHRAVTELDNEVNRLNDLVEAYENNKSNTLKMEARRCEFQVKIFLKTVVELRSEAGESVVEDVQIIQNAERALDNLERRLSLREEDIATSSILTQVVDTSTSALRAECPPKARLEAFWEVVDGELLFDQPQGDGDLSSSNVDVVPFVNDVSQTGVTVHRVTSGEIQRQTHSSRVSVASNASSRVDYTDARNDVDRVAKEAEMQVQNEEVNLRDSTIRAQLLAQNEKVQAATAARVAKAQAAAAAAAAVAQAQSLADEAAEALILVGIESQTRARAVESMEARGRIELDKRRFEIEAARNLGHAVLDDQEAEERGSVHGLGSNGTDQWVRESQEGQGVNAELGHRNQGGGLSTLGMGVQLSLSHEQGFRLCFSSE